MSSLNLDRNRLEAFANQFAASLNNDAAELAFRAYTKVLLEAIQGVLQLIDGLAASTQGVDTAARRDD